MIVVIGTPDSGKSEFAEKVISSIEGVKYYLATMETLTEASKERIEKHRKLREGKDFLTVEKEVNLEEVAPIFAGKNVLLECMTNLVTNELYNYCGDRAAEEEDIQAIANKVVSEVQAVADSASEIVIVTNNAFAGSDAENDWSFSYSKIMGMVNLEILAKADTVYNVSKGRGACLKGENKWES